MKAAIFQHKVNEKCQKKLQHDDIACPTIARDNKKFIFMRISIHYKNVPLDPVAQLPNPRENFTLVSLSSLYNNMSFEQENRNHFSSSLRLHDKGDNSGADWI